LKEDSGDDCGTRAGCSYVIGLNAEVEDREYNEAAQMYRVSKSNLRAGCRTHGSLEEKAMTTRYFFRVAIFKRLRKMGGSTKIALSVTISTTIIALNRTSCWLSAKPRHYNEGPT
jgi:hypothetical protein